MASRQQRSMGPGKINTDGSQSRLEFAEGRIRPSVDLQFTVGRALPAHLVLSLSFVSGSGAERTTVLTRGIGVAAGLTGDLSHSRRVSALFGKGLAGTEEAGQRGGPTQLSDREFGAIHLSGAGKQNRGIAEALGLGGKTVESHRQNIKMKPGILSTVDLSKPAKNWHQAFCARPAL